MSTSNDKADTVYTNQQLKQISDLTLAHYDQRAASFWQGTRDHDVSQNIQALLSAIDGEPPYTILDFGCGPGRDLLQFTELEHTAVGLEGAASFAAMAAAHSGCEVLHQDFMQLDLPQNRFDGVFANASLFHVPSQALPTVLQQLRNSLKPGGVLFSSNPHGQDEEGWSAGRYGTYHSESGWRGYLTAAGYDALSQYYRPSGLPRAQQPWLASLWRKPC